MSDPAAEGGAWWPLLFATALAAGIGLERSGVRQTMFRRRLGACAVAAGGALAVMSARTLADARTACRHGARARTLVTTGAFAYTRNPAYVGATSIAIGAALYADSLFALTLVPVALAVLDARVVEPEERDLERQFGDAFRAYRSATPRWFSFL